MQRKVPKKKKEKQKKGRRKNNSIMESTISMQDMRHLNLFQNITKISTRFCFEYNGMIFFCVPGELVSKAIGENGKNSKQLSQIIGRKIKIITNPLGINNAEEFVRGIVSPAEFKNLEIRDNEIIIHAGSKNKAALIGRDKRRFFEMKKIIKDFFGKELRIV